MQEIHFTDIEKLKQQIGYQWSPWGNSRVITQKDIDAFSELTNNRQWIHIDQERSEKDSPYGGIIAHGIFIFSLIPPLLTDHTFKVVGSNQMIIRGGEKFRFVSPVYPGQMIVARQRLIDVVKKRKGTVLSWEIEIHTPIASSVPAVTATVHLQYF